MVRHRVAMSHVMSGVNGGPGWTTAQSQCVCHDRRSARTSQGPSLAELDRVSTDGRRQKWLWHQDLKRSEEITSVKPARQTTERIQIYLNILGSKLPPFPCQIR